MQPFTEQDRAHPETTPAWAPGRLVASVVSDAESANSQSDHDLDVSSAEMADTLTELTRVLQFRDRDRVCRVAPDVTVAECYGLHSITQASEQGTGLSVTELADTLFVDKSTASRIARQLEGKGLVERSPDPHDARALRVVASPAGTRAAQRIRAELIRENRRVLKDFDPEVRGAMIALASRLTRALTACCSPEDTGEEAPGGQR